MIRPIHAARAVRLGAGAALIALLAACGGGDGDPIAETASGRVAGSQANGVVSFKGIPYAAAPVGALRWKPPQAPASWALARQATSFAPHCPQPGTLFGQGSDNEDCLYLNVFTPSTSGKRPVMVWIHGGAFYLGESDDYDPSRLVAQDVVVVTLNYRLGALGFMGHAALAGEQGGNSGNYGLMDQQAALRWVKANIANFGGDPANVTIFGESAGGFSVHSHLASAGSAGLFHKAIIQSGGYALGGQDTAAAAAAKGAAFATAAGCTDQSLTCLRALPVSTILTAQMAAWPSGPIPSVDGTVLGAPVATRLATGTYNKVPVMQGSTQDEWRLFVALDELTPSSTATPYKGAPLTLANYSQALVGTFPFLAAGAAGLTNFVYPPSAYGGSPSVALGALGTDLLFSCTARTSNLLQGAAAQTVYAYEFADRSAPETIPKVSFAQGAAHTTELQYLFNMRALDATQQSLSDAMVGYWTRFAKTGNPNASATPTAWPAFTPAAENVLTLKPGATGVTTTFGTDHKCTTVWAG